MPVEEAFKLTKFSSILTAESYAIYKALEFIYNIDLEKNYIFSDSLSALSVICNNDYHEVAVIQSIRNTVNKLLSSGTAVSFV